MSKSVERRTKHQSDPAPEAEAVTATKTEPGEPEAKAPEPEAPAEPKVEEQPKAAEATPTEPAIDPLATVDGPMLCVGGPLDGQIIETHGEWRGEEYGPQTVRLDGYGAKMVLLHRDSTPNEAVKAAAERWEEL